MLNEDADKLLNYLLSFNAETEWIEFKHNYSIEPKEIGEYISALSNSACLKDQHRGYLVFGIEDKTHAVVGTNFKPRSEKVNGQELISWLETQLKPGIIFTFHEIQRDGQLIVITEIFAAVGYPVAFRNESYIRVGTYKKKLKEYPGKERELWERLSKKDYETQISLEGVSPERVLSLLDYPSLYDLLKISLPINASSILSLLVSEGLMIMRGELCDITNMGALLFARDLQSFDNINRKAVRVIVYKGNDRREAVREQVGSRGYASGFAGLIRYILEQIPSNELMGQALRREVKMYPHLAIRELVANAIIHQDLSIRGVCPMIEIFANRIEFCNPGSPLIETLRFLDHPPTSRNEKIASLMRRMGVCEERGSGVDKVVFQAELFQLPAPDFESGDDFTRVTLFSHKSFKDMDRADKIRATYQHAALKYISKDQLTNESLRKRFNISSRNYPQASRIIAETEREHLIKPFNPESNSRKFARYVPFWA